MKVVLFCGGSGLRLREHSENVPKPLVKIGQWPIVLHLMKYYAHWGHKDFVLCLGWNSEAFRNYFRGCGTSDDHSIFSGDQIELLHSDMDDWRITFVDTGIQANVGQRLAAVREYLEGEETFLANYADGLSDLPLPTIIDYFQDHRATAAFVAVRPQDSWHTVDMHHDGAVCDVQPISALDTWMNGGFFVFNRRIFDSLRRAKNWCMNRFAALSSSGNCSRSSTMASGAAWILLKISSGWKIWSPVGKLPGKFGTIRHLPKMATSIRTRR